VRAGTLGVKNTFLLEVDADAVVLTLEAFALRQAENGILVEEVCRKLGVSEATFYRWKKQFAGMGVVEIRRLKQLEDENAKLKRLVADLSLDKTMLQDVLRRKF
jgi:putative transposase